MSRVHFVIELKKAKPQSRWGLSKRDLALGIDLELEELDTEKPRSQLSRPVKRFPQRYPLLKRLAWQVKEAKEIRPKEALDFTNAIGDTSTLHHG